MYSSFGVGWFSGEFVGHLGVTYVLLGFKIFALEVQQRRQLEIFLQPISEGRGIADSCVNESYEVGVVCLASWTSSVKIPTFREGFGFHGC